MALPNIFDRSVADHLILRINTLLPTTPQVWGKMNVAQMLAHCNVTYEMAFENIHPKPNVFMKIILKTFIKSKVTDETPYKHNMQTAPAFVIKDKKEFETEKKRLDNYINKTQQVGKGYFENRESLSFGKLTSTEWNNMFYKHLDHHLKQFGV